MANAAYQVLGGKISSGAVITKYGHSQGAIGSLQILEAGHPVPDESSVRAAQTVLALTERLSPEDCVLFLISGGGSALFESPLVPFEETEDITKQLLACGADIVEMNTIRKRLSAVKGGRFALHCQPASVYSIILSDIIGDPLDMIASGPAYPDGSTCQQALAIAEKYQLRLSDAAKACLAQETPKALPNVTSHVTGSVRKLCAAAEKAAQSLGYSCIRLTDCLNCEAREAGRFLASIAKTHADTARPLAFLAGGETVVHLTGHGRIRSLRLPRQRASPVFRKPPRFLLAPTAPTAQRTRRAVTSIRTAFPPCGQQGSTPATFFGRTTPIPPLQKSAG